MKLSTAILLSVIAHIVLLLVLTNIEQTQPIKSIENQQPIVTAQLIFTKPEPKPAPLPKLEKQTTQTPEPIQKPTLESASTTEPTAQSKTQPTPEPVATLQSSAETPNLQDQKKEQNTLPTASFDPYASLDQFIHQQTNDFINNSSQTELRARNNAINNIPSTITSINSKDDSPIKEIFETAQRIDADTRVVNYNGRCVQIKRELDENGFSQFKWTGTTLDCGLNSDMKAQLKQSLDKFLKNKRTAN